MLCLADECLGQPVQEMNLASYAEAKQKYPPLSDAQDILVYPIFKIFSISHHKTKRICMCKYRVISFLLD